MPKPEKKLHPVLHKLCEFMKSPSFFHIEESVVDDRHCYYVSSDLATVRQFLDNVEDTGIRSEDELSNVIQYDVLHHTELQGCVLTNPTEKWLLCWTSDLPKVIDIAERGMQPAVFETNSHDPNATDTYIFVNRYHVADSYVSDEMPLQQAVDGSFAGFTNVWDSGNEQKAFLLADTADGERYYVFPKKELRSCECAEEDLLHRAMEFSPQIATTVASVHPDSFFITSDRDMLAAKPLVRGCAVDFATHVCACERNNYKLLKKVAKNLANMDIHDLNAATLKYLGEELSSKSFSIAVADALQEDGADHHPKDTKAILNVLKSGDTSTVAELSRELLQADPASRQNALRYFRALAKKLTASR